MKHIFIIILSFNYLFSFSISANDSILLKLDIVLKEKNKFTKIKEKEIEKIKIQLQQNNLDSRTKYDINHQLYDAYKTFIIDSAVVYAIEKKNIALNLKDQHLLIGSQLDLAGLYSIMGLYVEAFEILNSIDKIEWNEKPEWFDLYYFSICSRVYKSYSSLSKTENNKYKHIAGQYRDSLLNILDVDDDFYKIIYSEKLLDNGEIDESLAILHEMLSYPKDEDHKNAVIAFSLANAYKAKNDIANQQKYLAISAILDIKNAIKENSATQNLESLLYETGDIENSFRYIMSSLDDAMFCNAHFRTIAVYEVFPIIEKAYQDKLKKDNKSLIIGIILASILLALLIIIIIYVYIQMKRIIKMRKTLKQINIKLKETNVYLKRSNNDISILNQKLTEANDLKKAYVIYFLELSSKYIYRLSNFKNELNKNLIEKKFDEMRKLLKSEKIITNELTELYKSFDKAFLHLYPNFIKDFNKLIVCTEHFNINLTELPTELRIFALIRLGMTDSSKIADFLHYSVNTIYTYRTKMRNKAIVPRGQFELLVSKIGSASN